MSNALVVVAMYLWRFQNWRNVIVPFSAAFLAVLAAGVAIDTSHYADAVVFVATGSVMASLGVHNARRSKSVTRPVKPEAARG